MLNARDAQQAVERGRGAQQSAEARTRFHASLEQTRMKAVKQVRAAQSNIHNRTAAEVAGD